MWYSESTPKTLKLKRVRDSDMQVADKMNIQRSNKLSAVNRRSGQLRRTVEEEMEDYFARQPYSASSRSKQSVGRGKPKIGLLKRKTKRDGKAESKWAAILDFNDKPLIGSPPPNHGPMEDKGVQTIESNEKQREMGNRYICPNCHSSFLIRLPKNSK
ncbi:hypothetical protein LSTR_LSTR006715 [Laodelphax striatellus]|uniref:Uncharacterized protein n=1 Tax=Laodelphax striatellus TaxID=195883 RepID=A0A482X8Y8_LAOST|nr:hypothetical protein LSTR_LSTR006715 [Laodelphax striatellus]